MTELAEKAGLGLTRCRSGRACLAPESGLRGVQTAGFLCHFYGRQIGPRAQQSVDLLEEKPIELLLSVMLADVFRACR